MYSLGRSRRAGVFRAALAVGIMAKRAGHDPARLIAFGDDFRQRRVFGREPVGRRRAVRRVVIDTAANFVQRELQLRSRNVQHLAVIADRRSAGWP